MGGSSLRPFAWNLGVGPFLVNGQPTTGDVIGCSAPPHPTTVPITLRRGRWIVQVTYDKRSGRIVHRGKWGKPTGELARGLRKLSDRHESVN